MKILWDEVEKGFEAHGGSDGGESVSADTTSKEAATIDGSTTPKVSTTDGPKPKGRLDEAIAKRQDANAEEERRKRMADNIQKLRKHGIRFKPLGK